jgi:predicted dehydrogenase
VLTPRVDIANARLRFASGLIANLTASRVSLDKVRKFRVFAPRTYISVDFARREAMVHRLEDGPSGPEIRSSHTAAPDEEPLRRQLAAFVASVRARSAPAVPGEDGLRALRQARTIVDRIAEAP